MLVTLPLLVRTSGVTSSRANLLSVSRRVLRVRGWRENQLKVGDYMWWSPRLLLAFYEDGHTRFFDSVTGKMVSRTSPAPTTPWNSPTWSPDRTRVISSSWQGQTLTWTVRSTSTGKALNSWSIQSHEPPPELDVDTGFVSPYAAWSEDGKKMYQFEVWPPEAGSQDHLNLEVTERDAQNASISRRFPIAAADYETLYDAYSGRLLEYEVRGNPWNKAHFHEWQLDSPGAAKRSWSVPAPKGCTFAEYQPSPDHKSAIWVMYGFRGNTGSLDYPAPGISLWLSGLHGENLRQIGQIRFPGHGTYDGWQYFGGLTWNPDASRISYIYQRQLYVLNLKGR